MQLLEEVARSVGFDIWKETFTINNDLILNCSRLKRFVYTHDVDDNSDIPSPGAILQALKKHSSSLEVLCLNFHSFGDPHDELPSPYIDSFNDFQCLEALWINCACFGDLKSSVLRTIPTSLNKLRLAGEVGVVADDLEWWAETLTNESPEEEDIDPLAGLGFSSDEEREVCGSQDGKGDSRDQAEDEMDLEEDLLEQEEDDMNEGEVDENGESEEDDDDDEENDDDGEDEHDMGDCGDYTEDDSEYEAYEESEHKDKCVDEHQDTREDEQDRDDNDENQQNENERADNQADNQVDNQEENQEDSEEGEQETDEDSDKENEGEDEVGEKRPSRFHIPLELAYDADNSAISDWVTDTFLNDEFIDFRDSVDSEPGQWYSRAEDPKERMWIWRRR
ncbi:hypothetical protein K4K55_001366 [Colletotrichum sp. SAR 10_96]|nr:hypothetical protein K4K55_001366 [Colletotrichum sp. SAR 10_96]